MKSSNSPRKVYSRNGIVHVLHSGKTFAPSQDGQTTEIPVGGEVTIEVLEGGKKAELTYRKPGKKNMVETWNRRSVPTTHRPEAE